jgi:hypothetical protein
MRRSGMRIEDDWLRRLGPAHFGHINFRGTMRFGVERHAQTLLQGNGRTVEAAREQRWPNQGKAQTGLRASDRRMRNPNTSLAGTPCSPRAGRGLHEHRGS